jgi:hypothetical protein
MRLGTGAAGDVSPALVLMPRKVDVKADPLAVVEVAVSEATGGSARKTMSRIGCATSPRETDTELWRRALLGAVETGWVPDVLLGSVCGGDLDELPPLNVELPCVRSGVVGEAWYWEAPRNSR